VGVGVDRERGSSVVCSWILPDLPSQSNLPTTAPRACGGGRIHRDMATVRSRRSLLKARERLSTGQRAFGGCCWPRPTICEQPTLSSWVGSSKTPRRRSLAAQNRGFGTMARIRQTLTRSAHQLVTPRASLSASCLSRSYLSRASLAHHESASAQWVGVAAGQPGNSADSCRVL